MSKARASADKRLEKAERILSAAASLIVRWGYNNTTMDDIAKQAGIAKGTLYLYWKTREDLFRALIKWERLKWAEGFLQRIEGDPTSVLLRGMFQHSALALMNRPLLLAVLLNDMDVLGKLAYSEQMSESGLERLVGFERYLTALRARDLVRTDQSLEAQVYSVSAIFMGFFLVEPMVPGKTRLTNEAKAELIAEAIHRTLETNRVVTVDELQPLAEAFSQYLRREIEIIQERFQQELE